MGEWFCMKMNRRRYKWVLKMEVNLVENGRNGRLPAYLPYDQSAVPEDGINSSSATDPSNA